MKLLHCLQCGDVLAMRFSERFCQCGKSKGRYLPGAAGTAVYSGPSRILGIDNEEMRRSMSITTKLDAHGRSTPTYQWFVILEGRNTLKMKE